MGDGAIGGRIKEMQIARGDIKLDIAASL